MKLTHAIAALAACTMMSGAALADGPKDKKHKQNSGQTSSTAVAGGVANADRNGATAAGVGAAQSRQAMRQQRRNGNQQMNVPGSAATSTNGAVFTTRRSGSAAINTNGAATGSGSVRSSSEGEVFSSTNRQGSEADAYGRSEAEADEPQAN